MIIRLAANVVALITTNHDKDHIMEEKLSLFSASDVERYINDYAIPWGINIIHPQLHERLSAAVNELVH